MIQVLVYEKFNTVSMVQDDALAVLRNVLIVPEQLKVTAQTAAGYIEVESLNHVIVFSPNGR